MKHLLFVLLVLATSGCFSHRTLAPLSVTEAADERAAILPVTPGQVRFVLDVPDSSEPTRVAYSQTWGADRKKVAKNANAILDTLAGNDKCKLVGPTRFQSALAGTIDEKRLRVYLDDPGGLTETWKVEGLADIGRKLGVQRIVVVNPRVDIKPHDTSSYGTMYTGMSTAMNWRGQVTVKLELLGLSPPRLIGTHSGQADFWGKAGLVGAGGYGGAIVLPYAFGKAIDHALDQAARQAFSDLLAASGQALTVQ